MSSVKPSWTCPVRVSSVSECYFEQNVDEVLVVTTVPDDGMFTWLRVYHSAQPLLNNETLKWAMYIPDADEDSTFILLDKWVSMQGQVVQTRRTEKFRQSLDIDFKKTKQNKTEAVILQQLRLRRLYAKIKQTQKILTKKRKRRLKF